MIDFIMFTLMMLVGAIVLALVFCVVSFAISLIDSMDDKGFFDALAEKIKNRIFKCENDEVDE